MTDRQAEHTPNSYVARVHEQIVSAIGDYQAEWPATDLAILNLARAADQDISDLLRQRDLLAEALTRMMALGDAPSKEDWDFAQSALVAVEKKGEV